MKQTRSAKKPTAVQKPAEATATPSSDLDLPADGGIRLELPGFEGPLDLLLHLIQEHELDILNIPIAFITKKYLEYIGLMQKLNIDIASEYLVMAATLAHIKSRSLLPTPPADQEDAEEEELDPRAELIRRLLEYQKYKKAGEELAARSVLGRDVFVRGPLPTADPTTAPLAPVSSFKLLEVFERILARAKIVVDHQIEFERFSLSDRINQLVDLLKTRGRTDFVDLFEGQYSRADLVVTFLALLELTKLRMIHIFQEGSLAPITVEIAVLDAEESSETPDAPNEPKANRAAPPAASEPSADTGAGATSEDDELENDDFDLADLGLDELELAEAEVDGTSPPADAASESVAGAVTDEAGVDPPATASESVPDGVEVIEEAAAERASSVPEESPLVEPESVPDAVEVVEEAAAERASSVPEESPLVEPESVPDAVEVVEEAAAERASSVPEESPLVEPESVPDAGQLVEAAAPERAAITLDDSAEREPEDSSSAELPAIEPESATLPEYTPQEPADEQEGLLTWDVPPAAGAGAWPEPASESPAPEAHSALPEPGPRVFDEFPAVEPESAVRVEFSPSEDLVGKEVPAERDEPGVVDPESASAAELEAPVEVGHVFEPNEAPLSIEPAPEAEYVAYEEPAPSVSGGVSGESPAAEPEFLGDLEPSASLEEPLVDPEARVDHPSTIVGDQTVERSELAEQLVGDGTSVLPRDPEALEASHPDQAQSELLEPAATTASDEAGMLAELCCEAELSSTEPQQSLPDRESIATEEAMDPPSAGSRSSG